MASVATIDQAEGLRRMAAGRKTSIVNVLSAVTVAEKNMMLDNLAFALARTGSDVLVLDARCDSGGIASRLGLRPGATLAEAANGERATGEVLHSIADGVSVAMLSRKPLHKGAAHTGLGEAFNSLAAYCNVLLVDVDIDADGEFPVPAMAAGETVVQMSGTAESIKNAYALIKRLCAVLGRRSSAVLVTSAAEKEAQLAYANLARTASRYLAVELRSFGSIPADPHLQRAMRLNRPVIDAFPLAGAAVAFRKLAERIVTQEPYPPGFSRPGNRPNHLIAEGA